MQILQAASTVAGVHLIQEKKSSMKRILLMSLLSALALLVTACGSPTPSATAAPTLRPTVTAEPSAQPAATQAAPAGNSTRVDITLADNTIQASQTTFQAGLPYTFVITNTGRKVHNFNINQPVSVAGSIDAALAGALLVVTRDQLPAGATATVDFTFPASAVGMQLEFSCLIRMHYNDGMLQAITVTP